MADESGGHADQPVPQGGDHGLVDAVTEQRCAGSGGGGELMWPAGDAWREQRTGARVVPSAS